MSVLCKKAEVTVQVLNLQFSRLMVNHDIPNSETDRRVTKVSLQFY